VPPQALPSFIPALTDEDRRVAFPDVMGHTVHDNETDHFVLFDQFEWQTGRAASGPSWDTKAWIGKSRDRFWFRTEGEAPDGRVAAAQMHALYGRAISPWWDVVAGIRQDTRPGSPQSWAAVGLQGLAPYWFDLEMTAYVGAAGRTHFRVEVKYELLLTNRLKLQPLAELEIYGKSDPEHEMGRGLATTELGLRARYEIWRELAPYVGMVWNRKHGQTAALASDAGRRTSRTTFSTGLRVWF
jgi:copper resistance protein B